MSPTSWFHTHFSAPKALPRHSADECDSKRYCCINESDLQPYQAASCRKKGINNQLRERERERERDNINFQTKEG
jgi:hypothetical protein